jgi:Rrf2 family nitric oxide-sensitive transcriptional repressor
MERVMTLTLFSDYSLRVLMFGAVRGGDVFSIDEVSGAHGLSRHHVAKVVNFLVQRDYLVSRRGRHGGIQLAREPGSIRVGTLLRMTEQGAPLVECFDPVTNQCRLIHVCRLKQALAQARKAFFDVLEDYTLADLIHNRDDHLRELVLPQSQS